jgi:hypothetical protein
MQWEYLERARKYVEQEDTTEDNLEVLERWEAVLTALEDDPMQLSRELDWVAKYRVLEGYRERDGLEWSDAKLRLIDLQYHDVRRDKGLYHRLVATGQVERLVSDEDVERAIMEPPEDTRAYFRGRCIARYPDAIAAASWDSIIFDTGPRRCSGCRCASRCAARRSTSTSCSSGPPTPARSWRCSAPSRTPREAGLWCWCCRGVRIESVVHGKELGGASRAGAEEDPEAFRRRQGRRGRPGDLRLQGREAQGGDGRHPGRDRLGPEENAEEFVKSYVQKGGE